MALLAGAAAVSNVGSAALALGVPLAGSAGAMASASASLSLGALVELSTGNVGDPHWNYVNLLLHGDGTNGSTSIVDSSSVTKPIAVFGNSQISTAQSKFGGSSIAFDGTGDYLQNTDGGWASGSLHFTVEGWVYVNSLADYGGIFSTMRANIAGFGHTIYIDKTTGNIVFAVSDGGTYSAYSVSSSPVTTGAWHHIAGVRNGSTFTTYLNGTSVGSFTSTGSMINTNAVIGETYNDSNVNSLNGYIDELRVTIGVARYTSNFSVPTEPFPNGSTSVVGAVSTATATLSVTAAPVTLAGTAQATSIASASLTVDRTLNSVVGSVSTASAAINLIVPLAGAGAATSTASADLGIAGLNQLAASTQAASTASASLGVTVNMGGSSAAGSSATSSLALAVNMAAAAVAQAQASSWLELNLQLTATAQAVAQALGFLFSVAPGSYLTGVRRVYVLSEARAVAETMEVRGVLVPVDENAVSVAVDLYRVYIASELSHTPTA